MDIEKKNLCKLYTCCKYLGPFFLAGRLKKRAGAEKWFLQLNFVREKTEQKENRNCVGIALESTISCPFLPLSQYY